jgi:hypothetical protein
VTMNGMINAGWPCPEVSNRSTAANHQDF